MKTIEQRFAFMEEKNTHVSVNARNYNFHQLSITYGGKNVTMPLTIDEMRRLATFLNKTAADIES